MFTYDRSTKAWASLGLDSGLSPTFHAHMKFQPKALKAFPFKSQKVPHHTSDQKFNQFWNSRKSDVWSILAFKFHLWLFRWRDKTQNPTLTYDKRAAGLLKLKSSTAHKFKPHLINSVRQRIKNTSIFMHARAEKANLDVVSHNPQSAQTWCRLQPNDFWAHPCPHYGRQK